ncbi:MAG: TAXI family TRAP transporter solute-binding subunit [Woeseiaceae bacterium]
MTALNILPRSLLLILVATLSACDHGPVELTLVMPSRGLDAEIADDLAVMLNNGSDFQLNLTDERHTGGVALDMLLAGEADLALVSNYLPYQEHITTIMPVYPSVLHIAYREGRDASDGFTLLNGARVFTGASGSASRLMFERIASRIGLSADQYSYIELNELSAGTEPDVVIVFAPISPQSSASLDGYRLFSFGKPADIGTGSVVDAAALLNPQLRPFVIPATTYGASNEEPVVTIAVDKYLVSREDLDASVVYDLVNAVRRIRPALSATRPGLFGQLGDSFEVNRSTFVLHAGAQNFLQRDEPTVYERYSGVAEVLVTLLIGVISAAFALFRILKIRRKNRIDTFYAAALAIRDELTDADGEEAVYLAIEKLQTLQDEAFAQLVDEKLSADESFRIFITLSNDILDQASKR